MSWEIVHHSHVLLFLIPNLYWIPEMDLLVISNSIRNFPSLTVLPLTISHQVIRIFNLHQLVLIEFPFIPPSTSFYITISHPPQTIHVQTFKLPKVALLSMEKIQIVGGHVPAMSWSSSLFSHPLPLIVLVYTRLHVSKAVDGQSKCSDTDPILLMVAVRDS